MEKQLNHSHSGLINPLPKGLNRSNWNQDRGRFTNSQISNRRVPFHRKSAGIREPTQKRTIQTVPIEKQRCGIDARGTAALGGEFNRIGVIKSHFYTIFPPLVGSREIVNRGEPSGVVWDPCSRHRANPS